MKQLTVAGIALAVSLVTSSISSAESVRVRFAEGVTRAFPVLRSIKGEKIAQGELVQVARGDRVESRLLFRFTDGSSYDETVVFSQQRVFALLSYRLIQRGPSFPESLDAFVDRESGRYEVRYKADLDSPEQLVRGSITLPEDVYNGMLLTMLKNLEQGESTTVQIMAFLPKPRLVKMLLRPAAEDMVLVSDVAVRSTRFVMKPELGLFASLLLVDLPEVKCWIAAGDAPGFLRFEGPLYFMGPVWRIELN
jgi:hypothetical protein